jgi:hypothetical protein
MGFFSVTLKCYIQYMNNQYKKALKHVLSATLVLTLLGYFTAYLFERSYLTNYGIPSDIFITVRPEVLVISILATSYMVYVIATVIRGLFYYQNSLDEKRQFWRLTASMVIMSILFLMVAAFNRSNDFFFWIFLLFGLFLGLLCLLRMLIIPLHVKYKTNSYKVSENKMRFLSWGSKEPKRIHEMNLWEIMGLCIGSLVILAGIASASAVVYATMFNKMPSYEKNGEIYVIIAPYQNSFIVKKYNSQTKTTGNEFYIVNDIQSGLHTTDVILRQNVNP